MSEPLARPSDPAAIVLFGGGGDLALRKLFPSLFSLRTSGLLPDDFAVIGAGRSALDDAAYRDAIAAAVEKGASCAVRPELLEDLRRRSSFVAGDFDDPALHRRLAARLEEVERAHGTRGNVLFYLATPPAAFAPIARRLGEAGLLEERRGWRRVIVEKPFGRDLASAIALDDALHEVLREEQLFRIDHYLGKETVQNLLVFRFGNGIFEPIWNRRYVDHVQITVAEELGVERRGPTYDASGALRDVIQNHVLQLLALVAMEPPTSAAPEAIRTEKTKVLEAIRPLTAEEVRRDAVRGQYGPGTIDGTRVPGYRDEPRVPPGSATDTYAALRLEVDSWRWAGVPFYVRSGKRLARRWTEIVIEFRRPPLPLFAAAGVHAIGPNRLHLHVQPSESISLEVKAKEPGAAIRLRDVHLAFDYATLGDGCAATGYERLLYDALVGDATQFHRSDMVRAAWRALDPVLAAWAADPGGVLPYAAGSWGPDAADALLARDGRAWVTG